jgi:hypothetical protein
MPKCSTLIPSSLANCQPMARTAIRINPRVKKLTSVQSKFLKLLFGFFIYMNLIEIL